MISSVPISEFCSRVAAMNKLSVETWLLYPGMHFGEQRIWWGDHGRRAAPHEGLDLCRYRSGDGSVQEIPPGTLIPLLWDGEIAGITDDFLGRSVFVRHPRPGEGDRRLYSIYGHLIPEVTLVPGLQLRAGEVVGSLAPGRRKISGPPPHLHLSTALIPGNFPRERLSWDMTASEDAALFIDPLSMIDGPFVIISTQAPA